MADVITGGPDRPRGIPRRWLLLVGIPLVASVAVAGLAVLARADHPGPARAVPAATTPAPTTPAEAAPTGGTPRATLLPCGAGGPATRPSAQAVAGQVIEGVDLSSGGTLERRDLTAAAGPWTVVVRRAGGSLGMHGAVVTFPVGAPSDGRPVTVGSAIGRAADTMIVWPMAGAYARVRGDLGEPELAAIAARTTVRAGQPTVRPAKGYAVVSTGPYRPPSIYEVRYGSVELGAQATLGPGLTYTGVTSGGGFEDQLYATQAEPAGRVAGRPAVVSPVFGGNATLAWEPAPGVIAYVGYSGAMLDSDAVATLRCLAGRTRMLTRPEWDATRPAVLDQVNEPG
jgi:hypothetical protein